jgi:hypothetical protein
VCFLRCARAIALVACHLLCACSILGGSDVGQRTAEGAAVGQTVSVDELDQITKNFADRYVLFLSNACDDIKREASSVEQRRNALRLKLTVATAAYDVATGPDAVKQLVDMAILVDLQYVVWVEEGQAERFFGVESGARLTRALGAAKEEIWGLSGRVMKPQQIDALKHAIQEWRRHHPEVEWVSDVRFDIVAGGQGVTLIGGSLGTLTPASGSVTDSIGNARLLGQRAFYSMKRLPILLDWQVEAALENAMSVSRADQLLQKMMIVLESATSLLARLDQILGPSFDGAGAALDSRLHEIQRTLSEGKDLAQAAHAAAMAVNEAFETARKLKEPSVPREQERDVARPFDINEYTAAAVQLATAAREMSEMIHNTGRLAEFQVSSRVQELVDTSARNIASQGRDVTDHAAWRAAQLVFLTFVLLSLYAVLVRCLRSRAPEVRSDSIRDP